jgi:hypothetical protein
MCQWKHHILLHNDIIDDIINLEMTLPRMMSLLHSNVIGHIINDIINSKMVLEKGMVSLLQNDIIDDIINDAIEGNDIVRSF